MAAAAEQLRTDPRARALYQRCQASYVARSSLPHRVIAHILRWSKARRVSTTEPRERCWRRLLKFGLATFALERPERPKSPNELGRV